MLELLNIANKAYPDNELAPFFDPITGEKNHAAIDSDDSGNDDLAKFIAIELIETFDSTQSRDEQIAVAQGVMLTAARDIGLVITALAEAA